LFKLLLEDDTSHGSRGCIGNYSGEQYFDQYWPTLDQVLEPPVLDEHDLCCNIPHKAAVFSQDYGQSRRAHDRDTLAVWSRSIFRRKDAVKGRTVLSWPASLRESVDLRSIDRIETVGRGPSSNNVGQSTTTAWPHQFRDGGEKVHEQDG